MSNGRESHSRSEKGKSIVHSGSKTDGSPSVGRCSRTHISEDNHRSRMPGDIPIPSMNLMADSDLGDSAQHHSENEVDPHQEEQPGGVTSNIESTWKANTEDKVFLRREGNHGYYPNLPATNRITEIIRNMLPHFYPTWMKIPDSIRRDLFKQWKNYVRWAPCDEEFMWHAFNTKASTRLSGMYGECKKKMKPATWMGESFWRALQQRWETPEYKRISASNKRNRESNVGGAVHAGGCVSAGTHRARMAVEMGRDPSNYELFLRMRRSRRTGQFVDQRAKEFDQAFRTAVRQMGLEGALEGGQSDASTQSSIMQAWKIAAGGKKKGRIYGLGAVSEKSISFPPENVGSSSAWEAKIELMSAHITKMNEELRMLAAKEREKEDVQSQLLLISRNQMMLMQRMDQINNSSQPWRMMQGFGQPPVQPQPQQQPWSISLPQVSLQQPQPWAQPPPPQLHHLFSQEPYIPQMENHQPSHAEPVGNEEHVTDSDDETQP